MPAPTREFYSRRFLANSEAGLRGSAAGVAYTASKHGVVGITRQSSVMYALDGIRVNAVAPGYVGTGWFSERMTPEAFDKFESYIASQTPMAMAAHADDIAGPIVNLLDPASRVITGEILLLDAGAHLDVGLSRRPGKG